MSRDDVLLVLAGAVLMLATWLLIRHTKLAIRSLERATLINTISLFAGISVGYGVSRRIPVALLRSLLPFYIVAQLGLIVFAQLGAFHLRQMMPAAAVEAVVFVVISLVSTPLFAIFLPAALEAPGRDMVRAYAMEVAGSVAALLLLGLVGGAGEAVAIGIYGTLGLTLALLAGAPRASFCVCAVAVMALTYTFDDIDRALALRFYQRAHPNWKAESVLHTRYTPYQKIEVLGTRKGQRMLLLDGRSHFAHSNHSNYSYFAAELPATLLERPEVCILGCGSMSTIGRIGSRARHIDIVDIDAGVFETSRAFFDEYHHLSAQDNWTFFADDAKHYLGTHEKRYDLIIHDIPPARTRQIALTYTHEFLEVAKSRLNPGGILSLSSLVSISARSAYGRKLATTMRSVFENVWVVDTGAASYIFGSDRVYRDRERITAAIKHPSAARVRLLVGDELEPLLAGASKVHIGNLSELIYD